MSLSSYARYAWSTGEELRRMLLEEEYEPWLAQLSEKSRLDLVAFERQEGDLVERIASAQPAQRRKMLDKLPVDRRFWAIAAAAQMAFEAAEILDAAELELRPGGPYRQMIRSVQTVLNAPYRSQDYLWPFPTVPPAGVVD